MSGLDDIKTKSLPSKHYPGQVIGAHTLVEPRGNPDHGVPLFWNRKCGNCGAIVSVATNNITALKKIAGCKMCKLGRPKAQSLNVPGG